MVRYLLVVEVADTGNQWRMTLASCPFDRLVLSAERAKNVVCTIFNHVVVDARTLWPALRARLNKDIRHLSDPPV